MGSTQKGRDDAPSQIVLLQLMSRPPDLHGIEIREIQRINLCWNYSNTRKTVRRPPFLQWRRLWNSFIIDEIWNAKLKNIKFISNQIKTQTKQFFSGEKEGNFSFSNFLKRHFLTPFCFLMGMFEEISLFLEPNRFFTIFS